MVDQEMVMTRNPRTVWSPDSGVTSQLMNRGFTGQKFRYGLKSNDIICVGRVRIFLFDNCSISSLNLIFSDSNQIGN